MRITEIILQDGLFKKKIKFNDYLNLIHSEKNSTGKTTLIRAILYALGYSIPSTKGIKFSDMYFWLKIENNSHKYTIYRQSSYVEIDDEIKKQEYNLPIDLEKMHTLLFGIVNIDIIKNLLGSFYMDQEKGWTLLNRGKVIGSIKFNIEELVRGLAGRDCSEQEKQLHKIQYDLKKYQYMHSVAMYQESINEIYNSTIYDDQIEILDREIEFKKVELSSLNRELKQINEILRNNSKIIDYISQMKLMVYDSDKNIIYVTKDNIVEFNDNNDFLIAKKNILINKISEIKKQIDSLEQQRTQTMEDTSSPSLIDIFNSDIMKIKIDYLATQRIINGLTAEKNKLVQYIRKMTKQNNKYIDFIHNYIALYSKELGVDSLIVSPGKEYIFTNNLKPLSGAILHKITFSFKLAYIKAIKDSTGITLPIIMDSPSGREIMIDTVKDMMKILQRDFKEHQLIIASIKNIKIDGMFIIKLKNCLFENEDIIE